MRRIVVFDVGWGGELVADFLMRELTVVEIVRVIDWVRKSYDGERINLDEMKKCLEPYVGKVDLIVLGGYIVGTAIREMERAFPGQKFVTLGINPDKILRARHYPEAVAIFMNPRLREAEVFRELREKLPYSTLILPECGEWERMIDENSMTREVVRTELAWDFEVCGTAKRCRRNDERNENAVDAADSHLMMKKSAEKQAISAAIRKFSAAAKKADTEERRAAKETARAQEEYLAHNPERPKLRPDLVLLLNTHFWELKSEIEQAFGWQVRVLDFREKLLHDVCAALKLRGVDGRRAK